MVSGARCPACDIEMMRRGVSRAAAPKSRGPVAHRAEFPYSQGRGRGYNLGLHNKDWGSRPMRADLRPVGADFNQVRVDF